MSFVSRRKLLCLALAGALSCGTAAAQEQGILSAEAELERFGRATQRAFTAGRYPEALQMAREAHAFAAAELGPSHPRTLSALGNIAVIHQLKGELDAALPLALRAAGELERTAGPDHPETLNVLANLAQLHIERGDRRAAEVLLRRVYQSRVRALGEDDQATLDALLEWAAFLKRDKRLGEIAGLVTRSAATARTKFGEDSPIALDLGSAAADAAPRSAGTD